jgi:hypothetical protein
MVLHVPVTQLRTASTMPPQQAPMDLKHCWMALVSVSHRLPMHEKKEPMMAQHLRDERQGSAMRRS